MLKKNAKVIVGMSGGVDSAVAAFLLKAEGYDVTAVFMQNWQAEKDDPYCTIDQDFHDAKAASEILKIPFLVVNFTKEYWHKVFQHFLDEYASGRTPNPDILCNKEIKFSAFLNYALGEGAEFIATGHYARKNFVDGKYQLLKGSDKNKDQSYFLYTLQQENLKHVLFPIGELTKDKVRAIALQANLPNHAKKDSTGICFIGERNFKKFLNEYLLAKPGDIFGVDGTLLGRHDGLMFYTLGQRQGLQLGGKKNALEAPWYVVKKDLVKNRLIVSQDHDDPLLLSQKLSCTNVSFVKGSVPRDGFSCTAKIRYRQEDQKAVVKKVTEELYEVDFALPQCAITSGQAVVFYDGDVCLGGGTIV